MTIDVDAILTDDELDDWLGGQVEGATTLRPAAWTNAKPARQHALDEILRIFSMAREKITETDIVNPSVLKRAVMLGAAARLYELAMTQMPEPGLFFALEKRYRDMFAAEVRAVGDVIRAARCHVDGRGRGRRVISLVRR